MYVSHIDHNVARLFVISLYEKEQNTVVTSYLRHLYRLYLDCSQVTRKGEGCVPVDPER